MDFQRLLLEVGKSLGTEEVKALTFLCADLLGQTPASVESASDLFSLLGDRDYLSAEQPQLLSELLLIIQRRRLVRDLKLTVTTRNLISPYRKLLYNLSEGLTLSDLKNLKFLLNRNIPRKKLEDHVTTLDVFLEMEHMDLISDSDLNLLESMILQVCPMLKEKIVQFREEHGKLQDGGQSPNVFPGLVAQETSQPKSCSFDPNQLPESHEGAFLREAADLPNSLQRGDECEALSHGLSGLSTEAGSHPPLTERTHALYSPEEEAATGVQVSQNANTSTEDLRTYPMTAAKRGICLIINNYDFSKSNKYKNRSWTMLDEDSLCKVFSWLGFDTETKRDCVSGTMLSAMQELSSRDHSQMDCLVCCILSHGLEGNVCGVEGNAIEIRKLMELFNGINCPSLAEKPKLFFIQACQGTDMQFPVYTEADGPTGSPVCSDSIPFKESIPSDSDFLLGIATIPSFASFRERGHGSWFIQSLCQNLIQLVPRGCDLVSILTKVNADVSLRTARTKEGFRKQIPQPAFTLTKKVIFPKPRTPPPCL